jgi:hypothetical protein
MEQHIDKMLPAVRDALIAAANADYAQAQKAGLSEEEMAEIVVENAITHILHEAELL